MQNDLLPVPYGPGAIVSKTSFRRAGNAWRKGLVTEDDYAAALDADNAMPAYTGAGAAQLSAKSGADLAQQASAVVSRALHETRINQGQNVVLLAKPPG